MLRRREVLGSQPSVPVIALTGDGAVCALAKLIASQEMLWSLFVPACTTKNSVQSPFRRLNVKVCFGSKADVTKTYRDRPIRECRLSKVEQIEKRMAKLIAGASIASTAGDTAPNGSNLPTDPMNKVQGNMPESGSRSAPSPPQVSTASRKSASAYAAAKLHLIALHVSDYNPMTRPRRGLRRSGSTSAWGQS